ncbi:MAG: DUF58 domain-containing protein [Opitutaceae bacterium]|nr:DUF58 domain-containing protein [Opitutaceae bacterium]
MKPRFVPGDRLLWLVLASAVVALAAGPWPELTPVWLLVLATVVLVALLDLALALSRIRLPAISIPSVLRFMRDHEGVVEVTFELEPGAPRRVRFALVLPEGFSAAVDEEFVELPGGAPRARITWRCTPRRRGRFSGARVALETGSLLNLWRVRARATLPCDIRVHPNLLTERKPLAALFLARGRPGARIQRTLGRGREFEKLREYLPGDGFDEIHWKATAKRGRPVTKVFQAERTQEVYVIIDASRLSARPVVHANVQQTALERCVTSALVLLIAAQRQGDRFGLVVHDDRVRRFLRAGGGATHYAACRDALLTVASTEATPDVAEIMRFLRARLRRRALLFFLTDLTDPVLAEDFARHAGLIARQHLVLVGQLRPPGVAPLFSGDDVADNEEIYARLAGHVRWAETRALAQKLKPQGVTVSVLENETMAAQLVAQYMRVKERQAL